VGVFDLMVDERRRAADLLASLTVDQLRQPSLCGEWTVHDVAAHLITYLRHGQAKLYLGLLVTAADIDQVNLRLTRREARRPSHEIIDRLRRWADSRVTMPRSGYEPMLVDLVLHDLDIRVPLGIPRSTPEQRLWLAFDHLTTRPALGFSMGSRLRDLRVVATDTGWAHGAGPSVRGTAEALLLAMSGRTVAFDDLDGDGVPLLRHRVTSPPRTAPGRRIARALGVLASRPPPEPRLQPGLQPGLPTGVGR
jgi:uncharacterized protein (TIGR03083 family)